MRGILDLKELNTLVLRAGRVPQEILGMNMNRLTGTAIRRLIQIYLQYTAAYAAVKWL